MDGTVGFTLAISPTGDVSTCEVTLSSGAVELDDHTCALLTRRAKFTPARDADGNATTGSYSNRVRWDIPYTSRRTPPPFSADIDLTIDTDGKVLRCDVISLEGVPVDILQEPCAKLNRYTPVIDENGVVRQTRIRAKINITHEYVD